MKGDRRDFLEEIIFRSMGSDRFTQDSPILPDVWLAYGLEPFGPPDEDGEGHDLLITPDVDATPHEVASRLREQLRIEASDDLKPDRPEHEKKERQALHARHLEVWGSGPSRVAFHQTAVVARLRFYELIRVVLPMSQWWQDRLVRGDWDGLVGLFNRHPKEFQGALVEALEARKHEDREVTVGEGEDEEKGLITAELVWLVRLAGTIALLARAWRRFEDDPLEAHLFVSDRRAWGDYRANPEQWRADNQELAQRGSQGTFDPEAMSAGDLEELTGNSTKIVGALFALLNYMKVHLPEEGAKGLVRHVNRNRPGTVSIYDSVNTVKADAVRQLFSVRGKLIRWAVIDSGIDARHLAFRKRDEDGPLGCYVKEEGGRFTRKAVRVGDGEVFPPRNAAGFVQEGAFVQHPRNKLLWENHTRIRATYDFTRLRDLLSADPSSLKGDPEKVIQAEEQRDTALGRMLRRVFEEYKKEGRENEFDVFQTRLREALLFGSAIDWDLLEPLLRVPHDDGYEPPGHHHGTHVAGILGADWRADEQKLEPRGARTGVAPEIELYDLRALNHEGVGDEFSIMGALQFVRHLNARKAAPNRMEIHGVNLSFSIRHEVSNYACGRTPVCDEAERLVGAGVVVVAAAGNQGRARYRTASGKDDEGYRSISITDPGNADGVITVGATHRREPHTYGVSYFSSRGPTGDGRRKPDLVAPGERIYSTVPGQKERDLDGTSMAAPHVSGAAALLMERNFELVGQPRRVKQVLCGSATDLGREPYFQGAGMLDILRALQSV